MLDQSSSSLSDATFRIGELILELSCFDWSKPAYKTVPWPCGDVVLAVMFRFNDETRKKKMREKYRDKKETEESKVGTCLSLSCLCIFYRSFLLVSALRLSMFGED